MFWWIVIFCILVYIYITFYKPLTYWKRQGIPYVQPWLFVGNFGGLLFQQISLPELIEKCYSLHNSRYCGFYQFSMPTLLLKDIDLIKQITVKDFEYFPDHREFLCGNVDKIYEKTLVALKGQKWKNMRSTLSPAYTGYKMRSMFILINECAEQFVTHFTKKIHSNKIVTVEMKEIYTRYANDVIATCAFGVKCDSFEDKDNEFYMMGKDVANFTGFKNVVLFGYAAVPSLMKFLRVTFFTKKEEYFYKDLVTSAIKMREDNGIVRPDMIHLLVQASQGSLKTEKNNSSAAGSESFAVTEEANNEEQQQKAEMDIDDIVAQVLIFFLAGFDGSSTLLSTISYELALNSVVQNKLQNEIDNILQENNGKITYDSLIQMKYLDMVVSEGLRKWPPTAFTDRLCIKPYIIQPANDKEKPVYIQNNDKIWIPIFSIHRDPKYFPDPEKFDPERFNEENKCKIKPFSYIPFGAGPRNCIGSRFVILEVKTLIFHILAKFDIVTVEKTQIPLRISRKQINFNVENGYWLGLKLRK